MNFIQLIKKKMIPVTALLLITLGAFAQDAKQAAPPASDGGSNLLAGLLVVTSIILLFVIWGMGQALIAVGRLAVKKDKHVEKLVTMLLIVGALSLFSQTGFAQAAATPAADAVKDTANYGGLSSTTFYGFVTVIGMEILAILFLAFSISRIYRELLPGAFPAEAKKSKTGAWWSSLDKRFFTRAVSVEKEADVMLDHNYDGIRELDNSLPPWWKWGFIFTIMVAFIYFFYFQVSGQGKNPTEEYATEMENARIEKEIFDANNKDKIDENNVPMADANGLAAAKDIFTTKCWPCHGKLGEGGAGPNLTDDYWLHKGSLNDIFHTIKNGYPDKGMQSWAKEFSPKEISYLASYIKTLRGSNPPNAKAPQGDLYSENKTDTIAPAGKPDSSTIVKRTDTTHKTK